MSKNGSLRSFLRNIYTYAFFNKLLLLMPVYAVFMQEHGLSDIQLSLMFIILSAGTFLTQIPVTWTTNKLGAKAAIILGTFLKAVAFVLWLVWPNFFGFAIGMFLWGIEYAFYNVAFEGLLYDELRARHHQKIYAKVLGVRYNLQALGAALSAFGSLLMIFGYEWITIASLVSLGASAICIARIDIKSRLNAGHKVRKNNFIKLMRTGIKICGKTPCILLMFMLSLLVANVAYLDDYLSPIGVEIGLPVQFVGFIQFFILGCSVLGQTFAYRFERIKDWILYSIICAGGISFVLFAFFYSVAGVWALGLAYVLFSVVRVLLYSRFQDFIPSKYRSVILSLYSIGDNIIYIGTCLIIGLGGMLGSWRYSILLLGVILIGIGLWAVLFIRNKCEISDAPGTKSVKATLPITKA